jgi:hypothetical protein
MNYFHKYRSEKHLNLLIKSEITKSENDNREEYYITISKTDENKALAAEK